MDQTQKPGASTGLPALLEAAQVARSAPAVTIEHSGQTISSLRVRLSAEETRQVMSLPPEQRAALAERILVARQDRKKAKAEEDRRVRQLRMERKRKRQQRKRSKR